MLKSQLLEENAELRNQLEDLKSRLPVIEADVRRIIAEEISSKLSVKTNYYDFKVSRSLYYADSYLSDLGSEA